MKGIISLISKYLSIYFSHNGNKDQLYKKELFYYLKERGGVYNKFLQVLSITKKFMEGWSSPAEYKVFNQANEEYIDISKYIDKSLFKNIEFKPIGIGSFAQVYKGITNNGDIVAIKILKPSVYNNLRKDLKSLKRLVSIVGLFMGNSIINIKEAFLEFSEICLTETDYKQEIANLDYFADLYENHPYIKIPKVYHLLCKDNVIVQEFVEGVTLADLLIDYKGDNSLYEANKNITGSNLWTQLSVVGGELLRTAMTKDFVYGDPHPGNIILLPNNQVTFIDFGIVARKPLSHRAFYDWTKSYYNILTNNKDNNNFYDIINTTCQCFCPDFINALNICTDNKIVMMISNAIASKFNMVRNNTQELDDLMEDGHMFSIFNQFMNNKNIFKLSMDMRNFPLIKAMQAFICTLSTIDSKYKSNNYTMLMICAMEYAFKAIENETVPYDYIENTKYTRGESLEMIDNILSSLAEGDEYLFQNIYKEMIK